MVLEQAKILSAGVGSRAPDRGRTGAFLEAEIPANERLCFRSRFPSLPRLGFEKVNSFRPVSH